MKRLAPLVLLTVGCAEPGMSEPDLLLPDELTVDWDEAWNGADDGLGALVPVDVMVYDGATGEPVEGVQVLVSVPEEGALPVPVDGVLVVDDETDPDALFWDASRDQYVALAYVPGWDDLLLETDDGGIARLYLYVDAFPPAEDGFADLGVLVATTGGHVDVVRSFELIPR